MMMMGNIFFAPFAELKDGFMQFLARFLSFCTQACPNRGHYFTLGPFRAELNLLCKRHKRAGNLAHSSLQTVPPSSEIQPREGI